MRTRLRRSGNLLLSALFMAAFLFFLSVALVLTNREDIQYTLFVDHKMRCNLAADGMMDYAIQTMRTNPAWEDRFKTWVLPFSSGAEGTVRYRTWVEPVGVPGGERFSVPVVSAPSAGIEVIARGSSGLFSAERHMLLEEFRLADSVLSKGGSKPHLFVISEAGQVQVLTPSFSWEQAGATLAPPLLKTASAGGGPLVHCSLDRGTQPPTIKDFTQTTSGGLPAVNPILTVSATQIPKGQGAFMLALKNDKFEWVQLPDPGDQLVKSISQPSITPDDKGSSATGWEKITLNWDTLAKTPDQLTVDYSYFNGPRIEWFSLTGNRAEVVEDQYICHGTHYFYSGLRFKNSQAAGGMTHTQAKNGFLYDQPCILSCNLKSQQWSVLLDYLKVSSNPQEEPTVVPGVRPDPSSLLVTEGPLIYTHGLGQTDNSWMLVGKEGLTASSLPKRSALVPYGGELLYTDPRGDSDVSPPLMALNAHDIAGFFPQFLPALNEGGPVDPSGLGVGGSEAKLKLRWSLDQSSMTSCNQDLFAIARLAVTTQPSTGKPPQTTQKSALAHFDGKRWQILPAGLSRMLPEGSSYQLEMSRDYAGSDGPISAGKLVLGGYVSDKPLLRRYVPVARWGPN
ncbi:hypothetical protein JST97_08065 [bacterium]|nr:hypothetical protein [bacterium]